MSRLTVHTCWSCDKGITQSALVFDDIAGHRRAFHNKPCHREWIKPVLARAETVAVEGTTDAPTPSPPPVVRVKSQDLSSPSRFQPLPPLPPKAKQELRLAKRGSGWFDVYDPSGKKINPTPVRKKQAEAFVKEANQGEIKE